MSFINDNFSNIADDNGYLVLKKNRIIDSMFPFKEDIEPRLVRFLRTSYSHKVYGHVPCISLEMQYHITNEDWNCMKAYLKKYVYRR